MKQKFTVSNINLLEIGWKALDLLNSGGMKF